MTEKAYLTIENVSVTYPEGKGIKDISLNIPQNTVTAIMGNQGSGKTTLLKAINRMHELNPKVKESGDIYWEGKPIRDINILSLRQNIGIVFREPVMFPNMNIYQNILIGYKLNHISLSKEEKDSIVERCLTDVGLWELLKDELTKKTDILTGGQSQRICIARVLALNPQVLLLDDPTYFLDNSSCVKGIEGLITRLKAKYTVLVTTRNALQAARISDYMAYLIDGELIEHNSTANILVKPQDPRTEKYLEQA